MVAHIQKFKIDLIRPHFIHGGADLRVLAPSLGLSIGTVVKYRREFRQIQRSYPHQLGNYKFRMPKVVKGYPEDPRKKDMIRLFPELIDSSTILRVQLIPLWQDYRKIRTERVIFKNCIIRLIFPKTPKY